MQKIIFIIICSLFISFTVSAQLSGNYTIGGSNPNYNTIMEAVRDLNNKGVSSTVIFNIRSGTYNEQIIIYGINGASEKNLIIFQSENNDSSSVIITHYSDAIDINTSFVIFKHLTLSNNNAMYFNGYYIDFENCILNLRTLQIGLNSESNKTTLHSQINKCIIYSNIEVSYNILTFNFTNNIFLGDSTHTFSCGPIYCTNNIVQCARFAVTTGVVKNNKIDAIFRGGENVFNNKFYSYFGNSISNAKIHDNEIFGEINISYADGISIYSNLIHSNVSISFSSNIATSHNHIKGNVIHHSCNNCHLFSNTVKGLSDWSFSFYCSATNNYFYNSLITWSTSCTFNFNNFSDDINNYIEINGLDNSFINNNLLSSKIYFLNNVTATISNNNYYPSGGEYDSHPWHINPKYENDTLLNSTNPQLIGKGIYLNYITQDIYDIDRLDPPSIGANEIFLPTDTVNVICGDSVVLSIKSLPTNGNFIWTPARGLDNINSTHPKLRPITNTKYYVKDTVIGFVDSIFVKVMPFELNTIKDIIVKCGDSSLIFCNYNASATYEWSPIIGISNPTNLYTFVTPLQTQTYIVHSIIDGCGAYFDSVNIFIDSMPQANFYGNINDTTLEVTIIQNALQNIFGILVIQHIQKKLIQNTSIKKEVIMAFR